MLRVIEAAALERPPMSRIPADNLLFLSFFVPFCFGAGLFLIVRDLPAVKRFVGEVR